MPDTPERKPAPRTAVLRAVRFTTATIVSFSFTLLAASLALFAGLLPLEKLSLGQRLDVGAMLFIAPVLALVLSVVLEAARLALTRDSLPAPRQRQPVHNWQPGRREG
jgi:hypothetical protein